jgi:hypothetical protein
MHNGDEMLRLVLREDKPRTVHFQTALFPDSNPRSFLLVALPLKSGKEFLEVVECTSPRLIVDLRDVPRFDFDFLSRGKVFEAFARVKSTYIDAEPPTGSEERWAELFASQRALAEMKKGQASGPCMFLFSRYEQMPLFEQFLHKELPEVRSAGWSILYIANQEEFATKRFTK